MDSRQECVYLSELKKKEKEAGNFRMRNRFEAGRKVWELVVCSIVGFVGSGGGQLGRCCLQWELQATWELRVEAPRPRKGSSGLAWCGGGGNLCATAESSPATDVPELAPLSAYELGAEESQPRGR